MLWVKSLYPSLPDSRQLSLRPQSVCQTKRAKVAYTGCPLSKGEALLSARSTGHNNS